MEEMTKEELQAKYDSLLAEFNNLKKEKDSCFDMYMRTKSKFDNFKRIVKSLVILVE